MGTHERTRKGPGMTRQVGSNARLALGLIALAAMVSCSSNPPPRPLPGPKPTPQVQQSTPAAGPKPAQASPDPDPIHTPTQAQAPAPDGPPAWYRTGAFDLGGRAHRAFAVTAADVREARGEAMRRAYEAYPAGTVAAHEAVREGDGRWTFYVLMASGG